MDVSYIFLHNKLKNSSPIFLNEFSCKTMKIKLKNSQKNGDLEPKFGMLDWDRVRYQCWLCKTKTIKVQKAFSKAKARFYG